MVDAERLRRLLQSVTDRLHTLRSYAPVDPDELFGDEVRLGHVKWLFVTAIEACIDAAHHVVASEGWRPPRNNGDAMAVLAEHEVLDQDLGSTMQQVVGFRNVLVHQYDEVDDRRVVEQLQRLDDLDAFVGAVVLLIPA